MSKKIRLIAIILCMTLFVVACSGNNNSSTSTPAPSNSGTSGDSSSNQPTQDVDRTLTIALGTDILTFDIHDHTTTTTEAVHINMFDYLVRNEGDKFTPHLAESFELVEDEYTWEFKLREGVKFHNGDELTSEDVKFTLERVATNKDLRSHADYKQIKEVQIIDKYKFRIITHNPEPVLLNRISRQASGILPKKYIEDNGWDHFLQNPVGTGALKFVEWKKDERIVLEAYDDYFLGKIADWDSVVFRPIPEDSTRVAELLTNRVQLAENIPPADWDRINKNEGTSIVTGPSNRTMLIFLRSTDGFPTSDVRVRQAIDYAIDNQAIIDYVLGGGGNPSLTRVNPGNFGANEQLYGQYRYDPEKAKQLLTEAGYPNGLELTIHSPSGRYLQDRETLEMVTGMLGEVGIQVKMEFMEWGAFVDIRQSGNHKDGYLIALGASLFDAAQSLEYYSWNRSENVTDWFNQEVEDLLTEAASSMDSDLRERNYQKVQELVVDEVPIVVLYQADTFFGTTDNVSFTPRLDEAIWVPEITRK